MGLFNKILEKIGLGKKNEPAGVAAAAPAKPVVAPAKPAVAPAKPAASTPKPNVPMSSVPAQAMASKPVAPKAISEVDVVKKMEELAAMNPAKLDWKVSIVDLLKLLDIDSSFDARKELATELGCPAELMGDSAKMNVWLHKAVLKKIAENGGNIPQALLD